VPRCLDADARHLAMRVAYIFVTDKRGYELTQHSAVSLALSQPTHCDIHVFCYQFLPKSSTLFSAALNKLGSKLTLSSISDPTVEHHPARGRVTTPTLLKLAAANTLVDRYDRIVYLDNDILVFDELKIASINFGLAPIAAVVDMDLSANGSLRNSTWATGRSGTDEIGNYFNAGMIVFATRNWRSSYLETYAAALEEHAKSCRYKLNCTSVDQCAINMTFANLWVKLPAKHNMQAGTKFTRSWKTAAVRHYCGGRKFTPVSPFRNDRRDVVHLNRIRKLLGLRKTRFPIAYEIMFRLNVARQYRDATDMRRFLAAVHTHDSVTLRRDAVAIAAEKADVTGIAA
jgi:lipopolysaccharide biosynthesis glycosyltransferase